MPLVLAGLLCFDALMVRRVSVRFEVELDDGAALGPSRNVEELRANGRWLRDLLAPVRTALEAAPDLRLVSWSSSAAVADAQE